MANLTLASTFDAGIYQIETADDVIGGAAGIANKQGIALGNRTNYLKTHVDAAEANITSLATANTAEETRLAALEASLIQTLGSNYGGRGIVTINSGAPMLIAGTAFGKLTVIDLNTLNSTARLPTLTGLVVGARFDCILIASNTAYTGGQVTFSSVDGTIIGNVNNFSVGDSVSFIVKAAGVWLLQVGYKRQDSISAGLVGHFSRATPPVGWLAADGSAVSRTTYARMFAEIGVQNGAGDGVTTFNVPDARGLFLRGLDSGRGLDPSRVFGTYQADQFAAHVHTFNRDTTGGGGSGGDTGNGPTSGTRSTNSTGGSETAPKNLALLACVKY